IPGSPDWVAIGDDAVWISNIGDNNITRIDPATNKVVTVIAVGKAPCSGLGLGFGSVRVPCCGDARVDDVTTNKVVASIAASVANSEGGMAVGPNGVWLRPTSKELSSISIRRGIALSGASRSNPAPSRRPVEREPSGLPARKRIS